MSKQSKNSKRIRVKILNPSNGCGHTSLARARRLCKHKQAEWVGDSIRLLASAAAKGEHARPAFRIALRPNDPNPRNGLDCVFLRWPLEESTNAGKPVHA